MHRPVIAAPTPARNDQIRVPCQAPHRRALPAAPVHTIYPHPHDIPLDPIITGTDLGAARNPRP